MSESVYDTMNVTREPEYEEPLGDTELQEPQYIELQQSEGVYGTASVAEQQTFSDATLRNGTESHEPQYIELQQSEGVYETVRLEQQEVSCQQSCY